MKQNVVSMVDFLKQQNEKLELANAAFKEQEVEVLLCNQCGSKNFLLSIEDYEIFCADCLVPNMSVWSPKHRDV
tara:strand:- start:504 stop:725 length:222 start_codon:yes stop_codon:yes gene_type:complete